MTTSEIARTTAALDAGAPIQAHDGSIARILGKRPVLWVGAGLSVAAGYPSTGAIIDALIAKADDPLDRTRSFYEVVDAVVASVRAGRVRDVLQRLFQPARPPTPLHRALARLAREDAFAAIVTTNYDDLLERALAAEAAPFVLQPLEDNATVTGDGVRLLKIHGSYDDWAKVVLSGRSYEQFGTRNPFLCKQLDVLLRQQPILFVGCSLQDPRILDWLAALSPAELEGLKEWRPVLTGPGWQTALAHRHRGAEAKALFAPAGVRPLVVRDHDHARALFVDAAARLPTPAQVVALEIEVTPTGLSATLAGAPAWTPADLVADAPFTDALRLLRAWDHQPLPVGARGELVGPAAARGAQIRGLAVQIGQRLSAEFLSPAALERLGLAIGASQDSVPPLLHVRVRATEQAAAQRRGDQILALPWELVVVEGQFPVERGKLDVAREVVARGSEGLKPPERPLSVVAAVSAPRDTSRLDYESECYQLWMAMGAEEQRLHITDDGQLETLKRAMEELQPQVLHFTGHGEPNALLFEDEEARAHHVPVRKLLDKLRMSGLPRLAFLASCHGATLPRSASTTTTDHGATLPRSTSTSAAEDVRDVTEPAAAGADAASRLVDPALTQDHDPAWSSAAQGDLAGARDRLEQSLRIKAKVFGTEDHPDVAASLHELARVLQNQGDLAGARDRLERSLRIKAKVFGTEDHPSVAASLHELARVLQAQGDLVGARDRLERVLQIEERVYGTRDRWSSAVTEEDLAALLLQQGDENDRPRAVQLLVHAYRTYQSQLGDDHPRTRALARLFGKDP